MAQCGVRIAWLAALAACGRGHFDHVRDDARGAPADSTSRDGLADTGLDGADATLAGTCASPPAGTLFCEDFEGAQQLFTVEAAAPSTVAVDPTRAYRGTRSLAAHATRTNEPVWILDNVLPAVMTGELHARWYIYIPGAPAMIDMASVHLVSNMAPNSGVHVGFTEAEFFVDNSESGATTGTPLVMPRDRWVCMQLSVAIGAAGVVQASIDGMPAASIGPGDTLPNGGYTNVHAGMFSGTNATLPQELWTDEIVVGTQPIACD